LSSGVSSGTAEDDDVDDLLREVDSGNDDLNMLSEGLPQQDIPTDDDLLALAGVSKPKKPSNSQKVSTGKNKEKDDFDYSGYIQKQKQTTNTNDDLFDSL